MKHTLNRLDRAHRDLSSAVSRIDPEVFQQRPAADEWSVAEVVQHLSMVEERVLSDLEQSLTRPPQQVGLLKKFIPMWIVSLRFMRVKAPRAVRPNNPPEKNDSIKNYDGVRARLKTFCAGHDAKRLKQISFQHPFLGNIDGVAAIDMLGYHEQRHNKQIREILKKLQVPT